MRSSNSDNNVTNNEGNQNNDNENNDECGICYTNISDVIVAPCAHKYCSDCFRKIYSTFNGRCSFCRGPIIRKENMNNDEEYDKTYMDRVDSHSILTDILPYLYRPHRDILISLPLGNGKHAGMTVENCVRGVKIIKLDKKDQAFTNNVRKGNVIKTINGLPAFHHKQVIDIINFSTVNNLAVELSLF